MTVLEPGMLGREVTQEAQVPREPRRPDAAASPPSSRYRWNEEYDEKHYDRTLTDSHHHPSISSTGGSSSRTTNSIDLEKQVLGSHQTRDKEEIWSPRSSPRHSSQQHHMGRHEALHRVGGGSDSSPHHQTIRQYSVEHDNELRPDSPFAPKAFNVLIYLMLLAPFLSVALSIWTVVITLTLLLLHPIRLIFTRKRACSEIILSVLAPALNLHLRCIYSFPTAGAELQLLQTVAILVTSCLLSLGLSIWCMVMGAYWVLAAIIGNPDGLDGRSDGREMVLSTRQKWDDWLRLSIRPELRS